jgi:N-acetyl-alpha-D-muramate 1-phosphate uridylyltransferase
MSAEPITKTPTVRNPIETAMILAAGHGTRMRPLTNTMPKPMVPVAGKPMIDHLLDRLAMAGVRRATVNVHYLAEHLEHHLAARQEPAIAISDERQLLLDSGGGVRKALPTLGDTFFVLNADTVWIEGPRRNLDRLIEAWDPEQMDILLLVAATVTSIGWNNRGDFAMDQAGRLRRPEPSEITPFAYAGVGIWKAQLFENTPDVFSLNRLFDTAIAAGRLFGLRLDGTWMHVGTPQALDEANTCIAQSIL